MAESNRAPRGMGPNPVLAGSRFFATFPSADEWDEKKRLDYEKVVERIQKNSKIDAFNGGSSGKTVSRWLDELARHLRAGVYNTYIAQRAVQTMCSRELQGTLATLAVNVMGQHQGSSSPSDYVLKELEEFLIKSFSMAEDSAHIQLHMACLQQRSVSLEAYCQQYLQANRTRMYVDPGYAPNSVLDGYTFKSVTEKFVFGLSDKYVRSAREVLVTLQQQCFPDVTNFVLQMQGYLKREEGHEQMKQMMSRQPYIPLVASAYKDKSNVYVGGNQDRNQNQKPWKNNFQPKNNQRAIGVKAANADDTWLPDLTSEEREYYEQADEQFSMSPMAGGNALEDSEVDAKVCEITVETDLAARDKLKQELVDIGQVCWKILDPEGCRFGDTCKFRHDIPQAKRVRDIRIALGYIDPETGKPIPKDKRAGVNAISIVGVTPPRYASVGKVSAGNALIEPEWRLTFGLAGHCLSALLDTGAGVNVICHALADRLANSRWSHLCFRRKLEPPLALVMADGRKILTTHSLVTSIKCGRLTVDKEIEVEFVISPQLADGVILGRPFLSTNMRAFAVADQRIPNPLTLHVEAVLPQEAIQDQAGAHKLDQIADIPVAADPAVEVRNFLASPLPKDQKMYVIHSDHIEVNGGVLEKAAVMPFAEQARKRSATERDITALVVQDMVSKGYLVKVPPEEAVVVCEYRMVDKKDGQPKEPPYDVKRFRLTLDCRPVNALKYCQMSGSWFVPKDWYKLNEPRQVTQYQVPALSLVGDLPLEKKAWYGKIDLSEAFYQCRISPGLARLFNFFHKQEFYQFRRLPMGWTYSPIMFARIMNSILAEVTKQLEVRSVYVINYQDDILVTGESEKVVNDALDEIAEVFLKKKFIVRPEKSTRACQLVEFCGYELGPFGSMKPKPSRHPITVALKEQALDILKTEKSKAVLISYLRSWAGTFNYCRKWLDEGLLEHLRALNSAIKVLNKKDSMVEDLDKMDIYEHVKALVKYYLEELPATFGQGHALGTAVVADANHGSWAAVCLGFFRKPEQMEGEMINPKPFEWATKLIQEFCKRFRQDVKAEDLVLLPLQFTGNLFSVGENKLSSTHRERVALLRALYEFRPLLERPTVACGDTVNLLRTWHDVDDLVKSAAQLKEFEYFCSSVDGLLHFKRDTPMIEMVDELARRIAGQVQAVPAMAEVEEDQVAPVGQVAPLVKGVDTPTNNDDGFPKNFSLGGGGWLVNQQNFSKFLLKNLQNVQISSQ